MSNKQTRMIWLILLVACVITATGCDGIYITQQAVAMRIADAEAGRPVGNATVELLGKYWDGWHPEWTESARIEEWFKGQQLERHSTSEAGELACVLDIYSICGGVFPGIYPGFDYKKDRVTGAPYFIRITKGEVQEVLTVLMRPENVERGEHFAVEVLSIGDSQPKPN